MRRRLHDDNRPKENQRALARGIRKNAAAAAQPARTYSDGRSARNEVRSSNGGMWSTEVVGSERCKCQVLVCTLARVWFEFFEV